METKLQTKIKISSRKVRLKPSRQLKSLGKNKRKKNYIRYFVSLRVGDRGGRRKKNNTTER